jgi:hypothetical protein
VIAFFVSYYAVQEIFFKPASFDKVMIEAASEMNKALPMMVDQDTRLDNTAALPGNVFQYNYTLINYDQSEINIDTVRKYAEPGIVNNVKTNPDMKSFRENKVIMDYCYKDRNGVFLLKISVTPEMYAAE